MAHFQIKICGITRESDLEMIRACGADAIGINLVPTSPRFVSLERAAELRQLAQQLGLQSVAVVMNAPSGELVRIVDSVQPDALQLHGHEQPEVLAELGAPLPVIKAVSWSDRDDERELARSWRNRPWSSEFAFLVDAYAPNVGGGTGRVARWDLLRPCPAELSGVPLLLAGGLKPGNVADAIRATQCLGVDTASGVESQPGIKDRQLVEQFVREAKRALEMNNLD